MPTPLNRRTFLHQAPLAAAALTPAGRAAPAELPSAARRRSKVEFEQCAKRLETLGESYLGVAPLEGQFLHLLVRITRARRVLELGACFGLGSVWLGLALESLGGSLVTIELLPDRAAKARQHLADFGMADRSRVVQGNAHEQVASLHGTFDLAFVNADKSGALDYFQKLSARNLAPAGVLAFAGVIRDADKTKPLLEAVQAHPGFDATIVQVIPEDGILLACRRADPE